MYEILKSIDTIKHILPKKTKQKTFHEIGVSYFSHGNPASHPLHFATGPRKSNNSVFRYYDTNMASQQEEKQQPQITQCARKSIKIINRGRP